jgi:hypothetical protein
LTGRRAILTIADRIRGKARQHHEYLQLTTTDDQGEVALGVVRRLEPHKGEASTAGVPKNSV